MEKIEFRNACYEVLEILKFIKEEDLERIPEKEIQLLENNANHDWKFEYNPNKSIKEQNVSKLTKGIIATYFEKYIATDEQKEIIRQKRVYDFKKYDRNTVFEQPKVVQRNNIKEEVKLVEYKKEKWYKKIFDKIKNFIHKN